MNADKRLDQLEPVISELLVKQDKLSELTLKISRVLDKQNDNVTFLLKNQLKMAGRIDNIEIKLDGMDSQFKDVLSNQDSIKAIQSLLSEKQETMFVTQEAMSAKQDFLSRMQESMLTEQQMISAKQDFLSRMQESALTEQEKMSAKQDFLSRMQETILARQDLILDIIKK